MGTVVVVDAAVHAHSVALAGFGLDSLIEILASLVVVWQLKRSAAKRREQTALIIMSAAFLALAGYVLTTAVYAVAFGVRPAPSTPGLIWLVMTVVVMLLLAWGKLSTGRRLENRVLLTEARVTVVDACLAAAIVVGVGLNGVMSWWWADPISSLVIVFYGVREALEAWQHASDA